MTTPGLLLLALLVAPAQAPAQQPATAKPPAATPAPATAPAPASPSAAASDRGPVTVRVNGTPIYKIDYDLAVTDFMRANNVGPDATEDQKKEAGRVVLDGLIGDQLLYQKARTLSIDIPPTEIEQMMARTRARMGEEAFQKELTSRQMTVKGLEDSARQNMMVQKMLRQQVFDTMQVSDDEVRAFFAQRSEEMRAPERVEASHILVLSKPSDPPEKKAEARKKIEAALQRVRAGEDFAAVAKQMSDDGSAAGGGGLGAFQHGDMVPPFEAAAFALEVGAISDVVETEYGFHVIKVTAKHPASAPSLEDLRDKITSYLKREKAQAAAEKMVESLKAQAKIETPS